MALALRFGSEDLLRCRFAMSPLWETTNAIRTLAEPQRHGYHLPWLRQVQPQLPHLELAPLLAVQPLHGYTPDFLAPPPQSPLVTIDQELDRVRSTPADVVAVELGRSLAQREGPPPAALRALLADPVAAPGRLSELLERCWQLLLAAAAGALVGADPRPARRRHRLPGAAARRRRPRAAVCRPRPEHPLRRRHPGGGRAG
jgi:hypothetical protein